MNNELITIKMLDDLKLEMVSAGIISAEQLKSVEEEAAFNGGSVGRILINNGFVTSDRILKFIEERLHIPFVKVEDYQIDENIIKLVPAQIARRYKVIPLFEIEGILTVAMADPANIISLDKIVNITKCQVEVVISSESSILSAINRWYGIACMKHEFIEELVGEIKEIEEREESYIKGITEIHSERAADETSVKKLVDSIIVQAVLEGASDIHLEPKKDSMLVRYRIDGLLYDRHQLLPKMVSPVSSRLKIMSRLDISQKRLPQDGRVGLKIRDKDIDIRMSTFPSMHGENIVLRLLDKSSKVPELSALGFSDNDIKRYNNLIRSTSGIILATGPTGSGKTTSLYSTINGLDKINKNIMTIEDPIEYEIRRIVQSQVDLINGVTFANALRSFLRQDPDIIYVGELRDHETAEIAVRAALTGHLVFSTLHTNDAVGAVMRLVDMGIEPRLIGSVLNGSFAQRLVRKICHKCKKEFQPDEDILKSLNLPLDIKYYKGDGCEFCNGIGYDGRTGIFETLVVNKGIRKLIINEAPEDEIMKAAKAHGMKTMFENGLQKVVDGKTTLEEVERVLIEAE